MRIGTTMMASNALPVQAVRRWPSGVPALDAALAGGLAYGRVHEVQAAEAADSASAAGFVLALASSMAEARTILWLRSQRSARQEGVLQGNGWVELGYPPGQALFGVLPDAMALLKAAVDALRCAALGAVVLESRGRMPELDLTASRRLALAAEKSDVPLFLLRVEATPLPSAAQTRWQVAAAPSQALSGNAPGLPTFDLELLRQKSGPSGMHWRLEWNRDERSFRDAPHTGAVVPVPSRRSSAESGTGLLHPIARRAA